MVCRLSQIKRRMGLATRKTSSSTSEPNSQIDRSGRRVAGRSPGAAESRALSDTECVLPEIDHIGQLVPHLQRRRRELVLEFAQGGQATRRLEAGAQRNA